MTKNSFFSILPLLIFVAVFLGGGIISGDFYALPSPVAALFGIVAAFLLYRGSVKTKTDILLKGCGDGNILTMCLIYLLAGAFASVTKATGSIDTVVNLGLQYISPSYFAAGIFVIACFLSFASGTSVGSIVTLAPIAIELAEKTNAPLGIIGASLLTGAMFGDNLSFISDTTIAATQSLGCEMKDKFRENFKLALPTAVLTLAILLFNGFSSPEGNFSYASESPDIFLILPYLLVIALSIIGVNVFITLFSGIVLAGITGIFKGSFNFFELTKFTYEGFTSMTEIFLLSLLSGGLIALVEHYGGLKFLISKTEKIIRSPKTALLGIGALVSVVNFCIANNTISILITGKIAKKISDDYGLEPRSAASVLDIFSCYIQGLIPYGAQILILISLSKFKIQYTDLFVHSYYLHFLILATLLYIVVLKKFRKIHD